jgi:hypothetical protein
MSNWHKTNQHLSKCEFRKTLNFILLWSEQPKSTKQPTTNAREDKGTIIQSWWNYKPIQPFWNRCG